MPIISEDTLKRMGFVCDWCGEAKYLIRSCTKGCTKICVNCLDNKVKKDGTKGWEWTVCGICLETIKR